MFDPRAPEAAMVIPEIFEGAKSSKVFWVPRHNFIGATGFNRTSKQELKLYSMENLSEPVAAINFGVNNSVNMPFYDNDTSMLRLRKKMQQRTLVLCFFFRCFVSVRKRKWIGSLFGSEQRVVRPNALSFEHVSISCATERRCVCAKERIECLEMRGRTIPETDEQRCHPDFVHCM